MGPIMGSGDQLAKCELKVTVGVWRTEVHTREEGAGIKGSSLRVHIHICSPKKSSHLTSLNAS